MKSGSCRVTSFVICGILTLFIVGVGIAAAVLATSFQKPTGEIISFDLAPQSSTVGNTGQLELTWNMELKLVNPNNYDIYLSTTEFAAFINGSELGRGKKSDVNMPGKEEIHVTIPFTARLGIQDQKFLAITAQCASSGTFTIDYTVSVWVKLFGWLGPVRGPDQNGRSSGECPSSAAHINQLLGLFQE